MLPAGDAELVQIVDKAFADAAMRSGAWLACRPGCNQCCTGVFRISLLDRERLRHGLVLLQQQDPTAALPLMHRIQQARDRLAGGFPGDAASGVLGSSEDAVDAFEDFANEEVCPVLDPAGGTCSLYAHRPITCRTFGPPVQTDGGAYGVCELCFVGAPETAVRNGELHLPDPAREEALLLDTGGDSETIVAFAFLGT